MRSFADIAQILAKGDLAGLVGLEESPHLEAKQAPYDLDEARARFELAKDVVAMANAEGGYLLIGPRTERAVDSDADVIVGFEPFAPASFSPARYEGVIKEYVHPPVRGLQVAVAGDPAGRAIGVIAVPQQGPDDRPFLIARVMDGDETLKGIVVGYVERRGGHNEPLRPSELQARFRKGSDTVAQHLARLEEKVDQLIDSATSPSERSTFRRDLLRERISQIGGE